jgi:predicted ABC-type ATPase
VKLHDLRILSESINDKNILKAIFIVAPPGGGKSSIVPGLKDGAVPHVNINIDQQYEWLLKNKDPSSTFNDAKKMFFSRLQTHLDGMHPMFIETTASNFELLTSRVKHLVDVGYDVGAVFIDVEHDVALKRVASRNSTSERQIPPTEVTDMLNSYYTKLGEIKNLFDTHGKIILTIENNSAKEMNGSVILNVLEHSRQVMRFMSSPVANPIGKEIIANLKKTGGRYLHDHHPDTYLRQVATSWYDKQ